MVDNKVAAATMIFDYIGKKVDVKLKRETFEKAKILNVLRNGKTMKPIMIFLRLDDGRECVVNSEVVHYIIESVDDGPEPLIDPDDIKGELTF